MKAILLVAGVVSALVPITRGQVEHNGDSFPRLGAEYILGEQLRRVLPEAACANSHVVFLERGQGTWFRVAFNYPARFTWKPPEIGTVWININMIAFLEEVPEDCRVMRAIP